MFKKSVILSLVLLLTGAALFGWALAEQKKENQFEQQQHEKFQYSLDKLNKLLAGEIDFHSFGAIVGRENSQPEPNKYKKTRERRDLTLTASFVCMLTAGSIFTWWLLLWTARLFTKRVSWLMRFFRGLFARPKTPDESAPVTQLKKQSKVLEDSGWQSLNKNSEKYNEMEPLEKILSMASKAAYRQRTDRH